MRGSLHKDSQQTLREKEKEKERERSTHPNLKKYLNG